jgi:hypothetical protein
MPGSSPQGRVLDVSVCSTVQPSSSGRDYYLGVRIRNLAAQDND